MRFGPPIWTDQQVNQWISDAPGQIAADLNCVWARECLEITAGQSQYRLPDYVRTLQRVTWRSKSLDPLSWDEFNALNYGVVSVAPGNSLNVEVISRPLYYVSHPTDPYDIRLYPCPNESFTRTGERDPYSPTTYSPSCIISYWRVPSSLELDLPQVKLPPYIERRTVKAFVLWKAFAAEGKGQDLQASNYYQLKYKNLIARFRLINEGCYISKKFFLGTDNVAPGTGKYPKPVLGPNFERVVF